MKKVLEYQIWHLISLVVLLTGIYFLCINSNNIFDGSLWSINTLTWFIFALAIPIAHQIYVLVCWRLELYFKSISNAFGEYGFYIFKIGFAILILLRPISIFLLGLSSLGSFEINKIIKYLIIVVLIIPSLYLFYSVRYFFGYNRAFGIDHFQPHKFTNATFEKRGIFKYTSNGMYVYGFLILWVIAIILESKAAIAAALFNHIYIWVHYYFTELPDIKFIYRN